LLLNRRRQVRVGSDGARNFADPHTLRREFRPPGVPPVFLVPDGELPTESDGLGVDAVRSPHHRCVLELQRPLLQTLAEAPEPGEQARGRRAAARARRTSASAPLRLPLPPWRFRPRATSGTYFRPSRCGPFRGAYNEESSDLAFSRRPSVLSFEAFRKDCKEIPNGSARN